jgi:hypothetical protein
MNGFIGRIRPQVAIIAIGLRGTLLNCHQANGEGQ